MRSVFILLLFFIASETFSQEIFFSGKVINEKNLPLSPAAVKLRLNDSTGTVKYFAITNPDGSFKIILPDSLTSLWLEVSMLQYRSLSQPFRYSSADTIIRLNGFAFTLPPVHIVAVPEIVKNNDTTRYHVDAFVTGNENSIEDLLKKLPGITVNEDGSIIFNGKLISRILLEGDDLLGKSYQGFLRNIGINGLNKIEAIENYADQSRIENKDQKGNETVLSLRYKNRKIKIFGEAYAAGGIPLNRFETKANAISLISDRKGIAFIDHNTIGKTATTLLPLTSNLNTDINNSNLLTTPAKQANPSELNEIIPIDISKERASYNKSTIGKVASLIKLNKSINLKPVIGIAVDNYNQFNTSTITYNNLPPLVISEKNSLFKRNRLVDASGELSWIASPRTQIIGSYLLNYVSYANRNDNFFSGSPILLKNEGRSYCNVFQLTAVRLLSSKQTLTTTLNFAKQQLENSYQIFPPLTSPQLGISNVANIDQGFSGPAKTAAASIKYRQKIKRGSFSLAAIGELKNYYLNQEINALDFSNNNVKLNYDFQNKYAFDVQALKFIGEYNTATKDSKLELTPTANLGYWKIKSQQARKAEIYKMMLLPSVNLVYKPKPRHMFLFSIGQGVQLPEFQRSNMAYTFRSVNIVSHGNDTLTLNKSINVAFNYIYVDPVFSGIVLSSNIVYTQRPLQYLIDQMNLDLYIINTPRLTNRNASLLSYTFDFQKTTRKKYTYVLRFNLSHFSDYSMFNQQEAYNRAWNYNGRSSLKTNWKKWINLNVAASYRFNTITTFDLAKSNSFSKNSIFSSSGTVEFRLLKQFNLDLVENYVAIKPSTSQIQRLFLSDLQFRYNSRKSISLGFCIKNLFNSRSFVDNVFTPYFTSLTNYELQPTFFLLSCTVKI